MLENQILASRALKGVEAVVEAARNAGSDCALLSRLVQKLEPFLEYLENAASPTSDARMVIQLLSLCNVLEELRRVVEYHTETKGRLLYILRARTMMKMLSESSAKLASTLDEILFLRLSMPPDIAKDIRLLCKSLGRAKFEQARKAISASSNFRVELRTRFQMQNYDTSKIRKLLNDMIASFDSSLLALFEENMEEEILSLRVALLNLQKHEDKLGAFGLKLIIAALEQRNATPDYACAPKSRRCKEDELDLPEAFICPISREVMDDPVMVFESGMTYDRKSIEEWFSRGKITDPETNKELSTRQITPNIALRRQIIAWRMKHSIPIPCFQQATEYSKRRRPQHLGGESDPAARQEEHTSYLSAVGQGWLVYSEHPSSGGYQDQGQDYEMREFQHQQWPMEMRLCSSSSSSSLSSSSHSRLRKARKLAAYIVSVPFRAAVTVVVWCPIYCPASLIFSLLSSVYCCGAITTDRLASWMRRLHRFFDRIWQRNILVEDGPYSSMF